MKHTRQNKILEMLAKEEFITTEALAEKMEVSTQTIRRDLDVLEQQGLVDKVYGGASLVSNAGSKGEFSLLNYISNTSNIREKSIIAAKAMDYVENGTTVAVDVGSTTRMLAPELNKKENLLIITKDALLASSLFNHPTNKVYLVGGLLDETGTSSGAYTDEFLSTISVIDTFFLSSQGITVNEGLTTNNAGVEAFRSSVLARARKTIGLADHTKFGVIRFYRTCGLEDVDILITDSGTDDKIIKELQKAGVDIIKAE